MIRLRTLGSVDLRAPDGAQVQSVLRQPKRLALLIYLAIDGPVFHRRDRLLALFWPESDEERARGALSQALFQLRAALGRDVIVNRGDDEIGVAPHALWADAHEFEALLENGDAEHAMALYDGELLPAFTIDDAPDFERWLDERRTRLATAASGACVRLSQEAEQAGDDVAAIDWMRRAISIQPFSEQSHQRLIALLDHSGDRAAALRAFDDLSAYLRAEFDVEPAAETLELMRNVRSREESNGPAYQIESGRIELPVAVLAPRRRREAMRLSLAVASGIAIISALVWGAFSVRPPKPYHPPADHVAVLFFNDESEHGDLRYLADGLTSTLIDQLGHVRKLRVISQNGVRPFRGHPMPLDSVASQLDVGTIVGGSVSRSKDRVRVTVELTDGATGIVMESKKVERPIGELFALLDDVSTEVASFLRFSLGEEIRLREHHSETGSVEAWQLYQRAGFLRASADSVDKAGDGAEAMRELQHADSLLQQAAQLDEQWLAPIVLRGEVAQRRAWLSFDAGSAAESTEWLIKAEQLANEAIRMKPRAAEGYELRGHIRFVSWMLSSFGGARAPDALLADAASDLRTALSIAPDLPRSQSTLSAVLFVQGRFEDARRAARRALDADAYLTDADEITNRLFMASFEVGDDVEAGHWCDEVRRRMANHWPAAYCDLVLLGWSSSGSPDPRKALLLLEHFGSEDPPELRAAMRPRMATLTAAVLARAGEPDSARALLAQAREQAPYDGELMYLQAGVRVLLDDADEAMDLLREYWTLNPGARPRIVNGRMFRPLRKHPEFRAVTEAVALTDR